MAMRLDYGSPAPKAKPASSSGGMSQSNALAAIRRATQAANTARRIGTARNNYVSNVARNARTVGKAANVVTRGNIGNVSNYRPRTNQQNRSYSSSSRSSGGSSGGGGGGYSSGGSSGGGGGGGGGGGFEAASFSAPAAPPPPVMQDITIPDATEDTDYKRTIGDLARALTDFSAQQGLSRKQYDTGYDEAQRRMGWNKAKKSFDRAMPGGAYGESMYTNENDFGGRGLFWSGLFGKAVGDINQDFAERGKNLDTARQDNLDTQNLALNTFKSNQESLKDVAKQNAISKIMASLGVQASEVPVGTGSRVIQRQVI